MIRKDHLQHTVHGGPTCKSGRTGASLKGEHLTVPAKQFLGLDPSFRCERCANSKLFAFLQRQTAQRFA